MIADTGTTKVIDTSAFVAITFDEPDAGLVVARLGDAELVAPRLFEFELANVCLRKMRQYPTRRETLLVAYRGRHRLPVEAMDVDHLAVLALA